MKVPFIDLGKDYLSEKDDLLKLIDETLSRGKYVLGEEVDAFETSFAKVCETSYAVSLNSGTDALILALKALDIGPGDEVITVPNSWISTASSIVLIGAQPIFVDVKDDLNIDPELLKSVITTRTKAIIPVHLAGKCAEMDSILAIAQQHQIAVIEDAAQSVGSLYKGKPAGSMGLMGCFSLHPLKNISGIGDGGILVTNDESLATKVKQLRNHGLANRDEVLCWGYNSRLDSLNAGVLNYRLQKLDEITENRRRNAAKYTAKLDKYVNCPKEDSLCYDVYNQYVIQTSLRDELKAFLEEKGVRSKVNYPVPIHLQPCAKDLNYQKGDFPVTERLSREILSLPNFNSLTLIQAEYVTNTIIRFFEKN